MDTVWRNRSAYILASIAAACLHSQAAFSEEADEPAAAPLIVLPSVEPENGDVEAPAPEEANEFNLVDPSDAVAADTVVGEDGEEYYVLPDFEVSVEEDRGYYSANALAGTRTNQAIKDTPMTISVVNQELLNDLNLTEIDSLSQVVASAQSEGESFSNRLIRFRGLLTRFQLFEFMPRQGSQNSYNVDRVEVVRGANSLVYGQAAPGGKANFLAKKALFGNDLTKFETEYGENNLFRATADFNKEINDQWAVRFMATHQEKEFDQDYRENEFDGATAAVTFRPTQRTTFRLHAEYFDETRVSPRGVFDDQTNNYGLTGIFEGLPVTPDIVDKLSSKALQSIIDFNDGTLTDPGGRSPQLNINSADDLKLFYAGIDEDNSGTIAGPDLKQTRDGSFILGDLTQEITDELSVKIAYAHEELNSENNIRAAGANIRLSARNNGNLRDPSDEPDTRVYDGSDPATMPSAYMVPQWQYSESNDDTDAVRTTFSWNKEVMGSEQQLLLGLDFDRRESDDTQYQAAWSDQLPADFQDGDVWSGAFSGVDYILLDDFISGNTGSALERNATTEITENFNEDANLGNNGDRNPVSNRAGQATQMALQREREATVTTRALWLASQGSYMNGRLNTLMGIRFDDIDLKAKTATYKTNADEPTFSNVKENYTEASPSLGVLFWVNQNIGVFANYAESIESPNGWALDPLGDSVPPELGNGWEGGIKFEFLDGIVSGQLIYFYIEKDNDNLTGLSNAQLQAIYPQAEFPELYPDNEFTPIGRNVPGLETRSQGVELDLYYNPTPSLSFFLGYAYIDAVFTDSPTNEFGDPIVQDGDRVPGSSHHNANLTTRYTFRDGALKGWYLGSNLKYRSKSYYDKIYQDVNKDGRIDFFPVRDGGGNVLEDVERYSLWLDGSLQTTLFVGWRGKLFKKGRDAPTYNVQLTVANAFDERDLVANGNNASYTDGRRASIKASVQF